jgi:microcystin-dependent protein
MEPIIGQIIYVPWGWQMKGWMTCSGQLIQINENQALFSLLGVNYGGDGRTTFALPDYRPVENGIKRDWHYSGELVPHIATNGFYPSRA